MSQTTEPGASAGTSPVTETPEQAVAQPKTDSTTHNPSSLEDQKMPLEEQAPDLEDTSKYHHEPEIEESPKYEPEGPAEPIATGRFNACFQGLSKIGPLALLAALACMAWPIFWQPLNAVYCPAEIKSVTAFLHSIASSSWLAPTGLAAGAWNAAQWPVFSWLTGIIALSPGLVDSGYLLPTVTFLCAFFAVLGVWCLAHAAGFGYKAAFASGLILLCCPAFAPLPAFVGPATLASGLLLFSLVFFCRGWSAEAAWFSLPIAFILTAFAFLCGGWFFLATPLIASFCFLVWRGRFRRAHKLDAVFGFVLLIAIIGIWLGWIILGHVNDSYLANLFANTWHFGWPINIKWLAPVAIGILGTMPWLLMIFGVSWVRVLKQAAQTLSASRHDNGSALIWISLVLALPIAFCTGPFHPAGIAIACLVATLLGKAMLNLGDAGNRFFCLLAAICLIAAGAIILCASFPVTQQYLFSLLPELPVVDLNQKLQSLSMLPIMGALVLLGGLAALMFVKRFSGAGPLIYAILFVLILCQPARLKLVPELTAMPGSPLANYAHIEGIVMDALATPADTQTPDSLPGQPASAPEIAPLAPDSVQAHEPVHPLEAPAYKMPGAPALPESQPAPETSEQPETSAPAESGQPEDGQQSEPQQQETVTPETAAPEPGNTQAQPEQPAEAPVTAPPATAPQSAPDAANPPEGAAQ